MRAAIVENNSEDRKKLKTYIERYFSERNEEAELFLFGDGQELVEAQQGRMDLIFLDIEMERMDGVTAAHRIREKDARVQIVFVTCMVQRALDGYEVDAADFLVKPVGYRTFCSHMDRVMKRLFVHDARFLATRQGRESLLCNVWDILFIESFNKKTVIHCRDGRELACSEALCALEEKLKELPFFRCHHAFLVNMEYVCAMQAADVTVGEAVIPVSKHRKREFLNALANYKGGML